MVSQYSFPAAFLKQLPYIFLSSFIHHVLHSDTHPCKFCYIMLAAKKKKPKKPQKLNKTKQKKNLSWQQTISHILILIRKLEEGRSPVHGKCLLQVLFCSNSLFVFIRRRKHPSFLTRLIILISPLPSPPPKKKATLCCLTHTQKSSLQVILKHCRIFDFQINTSKM